MAYYAKPQKWETEESEWLEIQTSLLILHLKDGNF